MTTAASWLMLVAFGVAVCDWIAVSVGSRPGEYVFKPLTMVVLIAAAIAIDPVNGAERGWFVAALVLSMLGDVFLMLPDEETWFVPGLASFLLGHIAYVVGMSHGGVDSTALVVGIVVVAAAVVTVGPKVFRSARQTDRRLAAPVAAYIGVISVMVATAIGTTVVAAIVGAVLFYLSDLTIGWSRFVKNFPASRMVIITTYHAAQMLLVLSLVVGR